MDAMKINAAVAECVEECRQSDQPLLCLAVFTLTLRADPGWEAAEVEQFETSARQALAHLLSH
jgi:hypothetical protein